MSCLCKSTNSLIDGCLSKHNISQHNFFCPIFNAVHSPDPSHLVVGFEGFGDAFALGHLGGEALHHLVGLAVDLLQVGVEAALQEHAVEDAAVVAAQVLVAQGPVLADLRGLRGTKGLAMGAFVVGCLPSRPKLLTASEHWMYRAKASE